MENLRYNISPCSPEEAAAFVAKIDERKYIPRSCVRADERSHYDRYSYICNDCKVAVVYDTTAQVISITGPRENADELRWVFAPDRNKIVKCSAVPAQGQAPLPPQPSYNVSPTGGTRSKVFVSPKIINTNANRKLGGGTVLVTAKGAEVWADEIFPPQRAKSMTNQQQNRRPVDNMWQAQNRRSDDYYTSEPTKQRNEYPPEQQSANKQFFGEEMNGAAATSDGTVGRSSNSGAGLNASVSGSTARPNGVRHATISFGDEDDGKSKYDSQSIPIRTGTGLFADISTSAQAQQVKSDLDNSDVSVNAAPVKRGRGRPPKSTTVTPPVVNAPDNSSNIEPPPEKSGDSKVSHVQAKLKKRLPTAYEYLSEQSRIDFSYGVHSFEQASLSLLDYSVLLVPPYRGLERFVFDLQHAEGINVKMIGQAYDKDDTGRYILKRGYQQRIGSVVYGEVMVSLYNEYFSRRNFFAHSDNTDGNASRSIEDRAVAKRIFDNLLNVVEYNARKLKEIGFTMNRDNKSQQ